MTNEWTPTDIQFRTARSRAYDALVDLPQYNEAFAPWYDAGKIAEAVLAEVGPLIAAQALRDAADAVEAERMWGSEIHVMVDPDSKPFPTVQPTSVPKFLRDRADQAHRPETGPDRVRTIEGKQT